jgi:magnesium-transporting ATPase (P-type)
MSLYNISCPLLRLRCPVVEWDPELTHLIDGTGYATRVQTSRLNEELAHVSMLFSDKTGTLTQNVMTFRKCLVGTRAYGSGSTDAGRIRHLRGTSHGITDVDLKAVQSELAADRTRYGRPHVQFDDKERMLGTRSTHSFPPHPDGRVVHIQPTCVSATSNLR